MFNPDNKKEKSYKKTGPSLTDFLDTSKQEEIEKTYLQDKKLQIQKNNDKIKSKNDKIKQKRKDIAQKIYNESHDMIYDFNHYFMEELSIINFDKDHEKRKEVQSELYLESKSVLTELEEAMIDIKGIKIFFLKEKILIFYFRAL